MDLSDDIAYSVHDFEDAIVNGYLDPARLSDPAEHESLALGDPDVGGLRLRPRRAGRRALPPAPDAGMAAAPSTARGRDLARLKNLTSDLIGRFARAATTATQEAYPGPVLTRYRAHVVVPRVIEAEMAVLKGIIGATVVSIEGRKQLYKEQRRVLKRLATALWETGPDALDAVFRGDFAEAETDAARKRVIVDQVASLTDQHALAWHGRLVGEVDAASIGIWSPARHGQRIPPRSAVRSRGRLMAGRIRQADVEEVKARTNIADIVGERVALKSAGVGSLKGLCPFHDERSPSFHVRPGVGFYHCFGCGESGDVYSFLRAMDHVSFTEAVERLAGRIGYSLHYEDGGAAPETSGRTRLFAANTAAAEFFRTQLATPEAETGRRFLGERGFDAGAAAHFGVGYAPKGWESMTKALTAQGFTRDELTAAGLVSQGQRGVYDRFRGRLVWPIRDVTGQIVGFGARKLYDDDQGPKYLNTPETQIYKKAQVLYGLDLAKRDITRGDPRRVVVVEGYTDVMACHLAGVTTAIATCGTAFGTDHITVLRRVMGDDSGSGEVVFTFDPDAAGQKAALRAFAEEKRFNAQTYVAVGPRRPRPVRPAPEEGRRRRALADGPQGADVRVRHRPAPQGLRPRERRGPRRGTALGRPDPGRDPRPPAAPRLRAGARPPARHGPDRGARRGRAGGSARHAPRAEAPAAEPEEPGSPLERVTLASLPRHHDVALERDALMAFLQYGHRIEPDLFAARGRASRSGIRRSRPSAPPSRRPPIPHVPAGRWTPSSPSGSRTAPSRANCSRGRCPPPTRPARSPSTGELARNLIVRSLDREKNELLGAVQRVPADSEEGRAVRVRLRDLDAERQRLLNEQ